jgi:hypothetical protein
MQAISGTIVLIQQLDRGGHLGVLRDVVATQMKAGKMNGEGISQFVIQTLGLRQIYIVEDGHNAFLVFCQRLHDRHEDVIAGAHLKNKQSLWETMQG